MMVDQTVKMELQKLRDREAKSYQLYLANLYRAKMYLKKYKDYTFKVQRVQEQVVG